MVSVFGILVGERCLLSFKGGQLQIANGRGEGVHNIKEGRYRDLFHSFSSLYPYLFLI